MQIEIENYRLPSRNEIYSGGGWRVRQSIVREVKDFLVMLFKSKKVPFFKEPVNIRIDAYYKDGRLRDSDNVEAKLVIDALKDVCLVDDNANYVHDVTTRAHISHGQDRLTITIKESNVRE